MASIDPADPPVRRLVLDNGLQIAYEERGSGALSVVLLHGLLCNRRHMIPLALHLGQRHHAVALDLRGHGESGSPEGCWSMDTFATDLEQAIIALELDQPVVVGHSFGGSVALALAARRPDFVRAIVLLDSGVRDLRTKAGDVGLAFGRIAGAPLETYQQEMLAWLRSALFQPYDPPQIVDEVTSAMASMPRERWLGLRSAVLDFDAARAALACRLPALLILSDRPFTSPTITSELPSNWLVGRTVGAGHFHHLIVPEQVHPMIDRFLMVASPPVRAGS